MTVRVPANASRDIRRLQNLLIVKLLLVVPLTVLVHQQWGLSELTTAALLMIPGLGAGVLAFLLLSRTPEVRLALLFLLCLEIFVNLVGLITAGSVYPPVFLVLGGWALRVLHTPGAREWFGREPTLWPFRQR